MEELFPALIFLIIGVVNAVSKAKKSSEAKAKHQAATARRETFPEKSEHPYAPAQPTVLPPMVFADVPGQVITPTVHPHVQPDCETHDAPGGSLGVTTTEGKDPCHEVQLTHPRTEEEPVAEEGGLTFDWTGENMVKAFVMQEILTRPAQRYTR